jgi:hypothetical protein
VVIPQSGGGGRPPAASRRPESTQHGSWYAGGHEGGGPHGSEAPALIVGVRTASGGDDDVVKCVFLSFGGFGMCRWPAVMDGGRGEGELTRTGPRPGTRGCPLRDQRGEGWCSGGAIAVLRHRVRSVTASRGRRKGHRGVVVRGAVRRSGERLLPSSSTRTRREQAATFKERVFCGVTGRAGTSAAEGLSGDDERTLAMEARAPTASRDDSARRHAYCSHCSLAPVSAHWRASVLPAVALLSSFLRTSSASR